jgi:hypothetical protein
LDKHKQKGVLILTSDNAKDMFNYAPNFASWLGARVYCLEKDADDFMFHSPPMSPLEILNLFLYGLPIPKHPRSS